MVAGGYTVPGGVATGGGVPGCPGAVVVPTARTDADLEAIIRERAWEPQYLPLRRGAE